MTKAVKESLQEGVSPDWFRKTTLKGKEQKDFTKFWVDHYKQRNLELKSKG